MLGEGQLFIDNRVFDLFLVPTIERGQPSDQLIKQGSQRIEVNSVRVPSLLNHLGRHILCAPTEAVGDFSGFKADLRESEVGDLNVSVVIDEEILGFEVTVDDVLLMQVHETIKNFDKVESSFFFRHPFDGLKIVE